MNKKEMKLIKNKIKECKDDIYFCEISYENACSEVNKYMKLSNLMEASDEKQMWLKNIYEDNLQDFDKKTDESSDSFQALDKEVEILEKIITKEKSSRKVMKKNKKKILKWFYH